MSGLLMTHHAYFDGTKEDVREALDWCFDNCTDDFEIENISHAAERVTRNTSRFSVEFYSDRDAVLFKTFWNDR